MEQTQTPYAPPKSDVEIDTTEPMEVVPAGRWLRFFNYVIDFFAMMFLVFAVMFVLGLLIGEQAFVYMDSMPDFVLGIILTLVYYIPLEAMTNRSLGKLITGTIVVNEEGLRPSFGQVLGRSFGRLIPFEPLSFFGSEGRGWHDSMSGTFVIRTR